MSASERLLLPIRGLLPLAAGLLVWQFAANGVSPQFPPPLVWLAAVLTLVKTGAFWPAAAATLSTLVISLVVASATGFALGLLIGTVAMVRDWSGPLLEYFRAIPPPVLIPIVVLMLGYSSVMKIAVVAFAGFWPVLLNTITGVSQIRALTFDVAKSFRLSWLERMIKIVIPATIPSLLLGVRVALPHTVIITLVVEMFTGAVGLGGLMIMAERNFNAAAVFGLLVVVGLLGFGLSALFNILQRAILKRWPTAAATGA